MTDNQYKWDSRFLDMAALVSGWSRDPSTKTGAVIVRPDKTVAGIGYNGFPKGMRDTAELYGNREEKYSRIIHCEVNALLFSNGPVNGCTLYTFPFLSCDRCFVQMAQAGIERFVAPQATEEQLKRWSDVLYKTRKYAQEMGIEITEYPH